MLTPEEIERFNQKKYNQEYTLKQVSISVDLDKDDYFQKLVEIRLALIKKYGRGKKVLDVGCGSGDYLFESKDIIFSGSGIDFAPKFIEEANAKKQKSGAAHLEFREGNAKKMPYLDKTFDTAFSFSALVYVPEVEEGIKEIARVLKPGGVAILEMGNILSLNTIVCEASLNVAKSCHVKIPAMRKMIKSSQLDILEWRSFGLLPFWGNRPRWLTPLLHPFWKSLFQKKINGKMLDEWISNLPLIKQFAFRHVIVCQKKGA